MTITVDGSRAGAGSSSATLSLQPGSTVYDALASAIDTERSRLDALLSAMREGLVFVDQEERIWVEGCWLQSSDGYGRLIRTWQPGHWEIRRTRVWVQ